MIKSLEEIIYKKSFILETEKNLVEIKNRLLRIDSNYEILNVDLHNNILNIKKSQSYNFKIDIKLLENKQNKNIFVVSIHTKLNLFIIFYLILISFILIIFFDFKILNAILDILLVIIPIMLIIRFKEKTLKKFQDLSKFLE